MNASFIYKNDRPWPNPRLKRAAIVGHVTAETAKIWFRTAAPGKYEVLVYSADADPDDQLFHTFKSVPYQGMETLPDFVGRIPLSIPDYGQDSTVVAEIAELQPGTEYRYALYGEEDGKMRILLGQDQPYRFRTMPEQDAPLSFAFNSCHMPYNSTLFGNTEAVGMEMWDCLNEVMERHYAKDFRFLIAGGDQVYVDGVKTLDIWKYLNKTMSRKDGQVYPLKDEMVSWYRDIYRGYWGFPSVRKAFGRFPTYMIWDDHELADGWGSFFLTGGKNDELDEIFTQRKDKKLRRADCLELLDRMKQAAFQVYMEYQHCHNPDTPEGQYDYAIRQQSTSVYYPR
jgi:alkaline phosphatase D